MVFGKISKRIMKNFRKYFGKINKNYKILRNNLMTRLENLIKLRKNLGKLGYILGNYKENFSHFPGK